MTASDSASGASPVFEPQLGFSLYPFQRVLIQKLARQLSRLVGDDMGLGKTYEGIGLDLINRHALRDQLLLKTKSREIQLPWTKKTLIITPMNVMPSWEEHVKALTNLPVFVINPKKRDEFFRLCKTGPEGYYIIHWEGLRYMGDLLYNTNTRKGPRSGGLLWFHVIADECHRLKGLKNRSKIPQMCWAAMKLRTVYKTAMSGTIADNKPDDIWGSLHWLWPKYYTAYWEFRNTYCEQEEAEDKNGNKLGYKIITGVNQDTIGHLLKEMSPWYMRRRKEDVLPDLPEKYYTRHWVDLDPKQRRAYDSMQRTMIAWLEKNDPNLEDPMIASVVVAQLQRLQQFALGYMEFTGKYKIVKKVKPDGTAVEEERPIYNMIEPSAKLDLVMELLEDTNEQVVIFSQFRGAIDLLATRLVQAKIPHGILTGNTPNARRGSLVADFQAGKLKVFAGTIAAGGVGITLTAASTVIFLDRAWRAGHNLQAEDRLHRIGQKNAVQVIDIMARSTVDMGRFQQFQTKMDWLRQILGDK